ncbi:MAG: purine-binding chemotaxis protein CheW [Magnetococcales bacterium]|nr:purine-binding chemotaxis protein CheW [Magnetococcales bacterium]
MPEIARPPLSHDPDSERPPSPAASEAQAIRRENAAILHARARVLAQSTHNRMADDEVLDVIEFSLNEEIYALELLCIREVYPLKEITELPGVPPFVAGLVNVRGQILSVNDIRTFFDMPRTGSSDKSRIIILHSQSMELGILADAIMGIRRIPKREILPSLPTLTGIRAEFLKGVTFDRTVILDGAGLLADPKILVKDA